MMDALFTSTAVVALAEIGDKTQLLAILLATRFQKQLPIVLGILVATLANHFLAALLGSQVAALLDGQWFRYAIAASFIAMAAWTLIPDKMDEDAEKPARFGAFITTLIAFFLVEMGDKTQVATIALGARFYDVFLGHEVLKRVPLNAVRRVAAALFLVIGLWVLAQTAGWLGA